jgi:hypothetical protein
MGRHPLLILTALRYEAAAIERALRQGRRCGDDRSVQLHVIGPGAADLPQLERREVCGIIMAGLAGAISPELNAGDIVIDELSEYADLNLPWKKGKIVSTPQIIATPANKSELYRATGALVVDMESEAARRLAVEWRVPYLGIRAVLDRADETLEPAMLRLVDALGYVRPGRLAAGLCRRPGLLITLLRMRSRSAAALLSLSSAVRQVVLHQRLDRDGIAPAPG